MKKITKKTIVRPADRVVTRYPIFPVRLRPDDRATLALIKERFGLRTLAEAVRVASRVVAEMPEITTAKVVVLNTIYQDNNPEALVISIPPASN
jgi:hypothetical protein